MTRYQTGNRAKVLRYMAECAIRDREGLIEAYMLPSHKEIGAEAQAIIDDCLAAINDFRRIVGLPAEQKVQP